MAAIQNFIGQNNGAFLAFEFGPDVNARRPKPWSFLIREIDPAGILETRMACGIINLDLFRLADLRNSIDAHQKQTGKKNKP